jgi:hypothetical protein
MMGCLHHLKPGQSRAHKHGHRGASHRIDDAAKLYDVSRITRVCRLRHFGLAGWAGQFIVGFMPSAWKIIVNKRPKEIGGPFAREVYLVALPEKEAAVAVLRMREGFNDAELEVIGEVPDPSVEGWDIRPGQVLCVSAIAR